MIVETRSVIFWQTRKVVIARTQTKSAFDKLEDIFACYALHIRSKIFCAVILEFAYDFNFGEILLDIDFDKRIRLVVFEKNVVRRLMLFDKIVFKHKRFDFVCGNNILKISYTRNKSHSLFRLIGSARKILIYSVLKISRLAYVQNLIAVRLHNIYAALRRQIFEFLSYLIHSNIISLIKQRDNKKFNPLIGWASVFDTYRQRAFDVFVDDAVKNYFAVSSTPYDFVVAK